MLSLNCLISSALLIVVMSVWSSATNAEILELGESQLHGKKDQPEAMTFVSRAPLEMSESIVEWKAVEKIKREIKRDIFGLSMAETRD